MSFRVLVVDDCRGIADSFRMALENRGHKASAVYDIESALEMFKPGAFDCIVTDQNLRSEKGTDLIRIVRQTDEKVGIVLMTGDPDSIGEVPETLGVWNVLEKPFTNADLIENVETASEVATMSPEVRAEIENQCETQRHQIEDIRHDMLNDTGIFRPLKK